MSDRTKCLTVAELERVNANSAGAADAVNLQLSKAVALAGDGSKGHRLAEQKCKRCYYLRGRTIVGHGFTAWRCLLCGEEGTHANTGVPRVCGACAERFGLCVECGGDLEMRFRTKRVGRRTRRVRTAKS